MSEQNALAYADSVNREICDEFASDFAALTDAGGAREIEPDFAAFFASLKTAAAETRELIAEIEAITR